MPELTSRLGLIARMYCYRRAGKLSHTIFTVSKFSKQRIMHHLGLGEKIVVTGSAIQNYIYNDDDCCGVDVTTGNKTKSILFIGNIKKHKGLAVLLNAFERARKAGLDYTLVIVGSEENFRSVDTASLQYCKDAASDSIRWTGYVSNEELRGLIKSAALLVQPSLYEGFCLPPLEAMMLGTPALISDIPVLKEVYADFPVVFFKAGDAGDLKDKLIALLHNKPFVQVQLDESQRNRYTFKKTAALILEVLGHEAGEGG
ncbi:MAG: glycosyltransferase family 4 protein [Spirochaetaceae bacterium]|nr:glycosyltransferase family 4 protein [Spirochaetaceae bacterium]